MKKLNRCVALIALTICVPTLVAAQQPAAPGSALADQLAESSLRMIGSMVAVLALVAVCAWLLRRWRDSHGVENGSIEIVSGITLGSKERIVLLRIGDEQVLVGVSPAGMRRLHVMRQAVGAHSRVHETDEQAGDALDGSDSHSRSAAAREHSAAEAANTPRGVAAAQVIAKVAPKFKLSLGSAQ